MKYRSKPSNHRTVSLLWIATIVSAFLSVCVSTDLYAQNIRGLLRKGDQPISGIAVDVFDPMLGASGVSYSGSDGMYYLFNIPPGKYTLRIHDIPNAPPRAFPIFVIPQQPWINIPPIQVR
jgi:hypothetical protein